MANFTLEQLLQYHPYDALLIAYNDIHASTLNPRYVELVGVVDNGSSALVTLKARQGSPDDGEFRFSNQCEIEVIRLDLSELFGETLTVEYSGEIVSHDVANIISKRTGVVFDASDFEAVVITPENNQLVAAPTSLRWYGQLTILKA